MLIFFKILKESPAWLKGGLISLIIFIVLFFLSPSPNIVVTLFMFLPVALGLNSEMSLAGIIGTYLVWGGLWFLIGALTGLIIQKLKTKNIYAKFLLALLIFIIITLIITYLGYIIFMLLNKSSQLFDRSLNPLYFFKCQFGPLFGYYSC
ncbi:MAG: hypothetical protein Q8N99_07065 [Nanoarchaeota archaeon]|nr:hypothetical protein [Nanoarchaeota archaeon]